MQTLPKATLNALGFRLPPVAPGSAADSTGRKNMQQLVQLRWFAVLGQIVTICVVHFGFNIRLPLDYMGAALSVLVGFNLLSLLRLQIRREPSNAEVFVALLVDVAMLTVQLYLSGGATNPFAFLYVLQVCLGAVLLKAWSTWAMVGITTVCFASLALVARPLALPLEHYEGLWSPYVQGMLICFVLTAGLLVVFITRINGNLRARDARLADLRQRAAEEEHIVRMGLLASGAAHELGTPLATLAVILGDWRRVPSVSNDPDLLQEVHEMQIQIQRCKSIVTGILLSAGEARGESPAETTVRAFLDELVKDWRATRTVKSFVYENKFGHDVRIVSDPALKQTICNVLDNALEASPLWVALQITRDEDALVLTVTDNGPGFPQSMLDRIGTPYQSTKGRSGAGLGLFLVVNVARTLGGSVVAGNRETGAGAFVRLTLPLESIMLEEEDDVE